METTALTGPIIKAFISIWWILPVAFVILFFKAKINKWEKEKKQENRLNKKKETKQKEKNEIETEKKTWGDKKKEFKDGIIEKGSDYELFVADHYRSKGYDVLEHGKEYGKLDKGIDLIAKKDNEIIIIQCKNWRAGGKFTIDHTMVKEFIGNVATFLDKNAIYKDYIVKKIFAVSEKVLDKSAMEFITANKQTIRYLHLPMKDSNPEE